MKYTILGTIVLGFLINNDSYDMIIKSGDGHLEFDGKDIIFVDTIGSRRTSHTSNSALKIWINQGKIKQNDQN